MLLNKSTIVTGEIIHSNLVNELHKNIKHKNKNNTYISVAGVEKNLDTSWLQFAKETYKISEDLNDYVIVDVPIVTANVPNRNLHCFPLEELTYFDPLLGKLVYETFIGSATFMDHNNEVSKDAKGVILDSSMKYNTAFDLWQVWVLLGFDRSKDSVLTEDILTKRRTAYSMGALVDLFKCSSCGTPYSYGDLNEKTHSCLSNPGKGNVDPNNVLIYENCIGTNFFETSSVIDPADINAEGNNIW